MAITRFGFLDDFSQKNDKVGIGTSTATEKLEIVGGTKSKDLKITGIATLSAYSGFIEKDTEGTLSEFIDDVEKYGCFYTSNSDGSGWLHSDWDNEGKDSFETGEQTSYSMHINSNISDSSLRRINRIAMNQ